MPSHVCGVRGFDQMRGDICPACSSDPLFSTPPEESPELKEALERFQLHAMGIASTRVFRTRTELQAREAKGKELAAARAALVAIYHRQREEIERLKAEQTELKREAILAFYNGASATTRRYVTDQGECDEAVDDLNDACERALRRLSHPDTGSAQDG